MKADLVRSEREKSSSLLAAGGFAALLASSCCLGPLVLVMLGFSGAWIGQLRRLEPYRPWFLGFTLLTLVLAGVRIFRPAEACTDGTVCATKVRPSHQKMLFAAVVLMALIAFLYPYIARFFY